jgi:hypothetical protein
MLKTGDRVRVVDDFFVTDLRGAKGTITAPSEHIRDHISEGQFWVEFDELVPDESGGFTEAGAFEGRYLQLLP